MNVNDKAVDTVAHKLLSIASMGEAIKELALELRGELLLGIDTKDEEKEETNLIDHLVEKLNESRIKP